MWYLCNDAGDILEVFEDEDEAEIALVSSLFSSACYIVRADEYEG